MRNLKSKIQDFLSLSQDLFPNENKFIETKLSASLDALGLNVFFAWDYPEVKRFHQKF
jgi:hypothetical protein